MFLHFLFHGTLQLFGVGKQILDAAKLVDEFDGSFFTHTWTTRVVIGRIAHQS